MGIQYLGEKVKYIADMSRSRPAGALSEDFADGKWRLVDYETREGVKGVMASALPETDCPELTLPLDAEGPHRIFLGINYTKVKYPSWSFYGQLEVKLTGEPGFRRVGIEAPSQHAKKTDPKIGIKNEIYKSVQEAYWKTADLTGKSLVFRQPVAPYRHPELANKSEPFVRQARPPVRGGEEEMGRGQTPWRHEKFSPHLLHRAAYRSYFRHVHLSSFRRNLVRKRADAVS